MGEACSKPSLSMAFSTSGERFSSEKSLVVMLRVYSSAPATYVLAPPDATPCLLERGFQAASTFPTRDPTPRPKPSKVQQHRRVRRVAPRAPQARPPSPIRS